eukprot:6511618-Pyramimonas_sp.AAC.1
MAGCRSARFLVLAGVVASPTYARVGIIAGCSFATTMIIIFALRGFDQLEVPKGIAFDAYIDDLG